VKISIPNEATLALPEHWVNVKSLKWLMKSLAAYETMAGHIATAVYTGDLHKMRVDDDVLICAIPAMPFNGGMVLLTLGFNSGPQGSWDLTSVIVDDDNGSIRKITPELGELAL